MVIPPGKVVKFIITADDVIHSFAVPAFWIKQDANPGQLHETWVKVDRPGVYFGQCSELCGARHGYMPIAVEVVPPAQFAQWVAAKGGIGTRRGADSTRLRQQRARRRPRADRRPPPSNRLYHGSDRQDCLKRRALDPHGRPRGHLSSPSTNPRHRDHQT